MVTNTHKLNSLIQLSVETAREELDKLPMRQYEEALPEDLYKTLFNALCTVDETHKLILKAIKAIMECNPEEKPSLEADHVFDSEKTVFRLFYMLNNELTNWRYSPYYADGKKPEL